MQYCDGLLSNSSLFVWKLQLSLATHFIHTYEREFYHNMWLSQQIIEILIYAYTKLISEQADCGLISNGYRRTRL